MRTNVKLYTESVFRTLWTTVLVIKLKTTFHICRILKINLYYILVMYFCKSKKHESNCYCFSVMTCHSSDYRVRGKRVLPVFTLQVRHCSRVNRHSSVSQQSSNRIILSIKYKSLTCHSVLRMLGLIFKYFSKHQQTKSDT